MTNNTPVPLREQLAAYAHDAWSGWMHYLFAQSQRHADGTVTIPAALVERWQRQMDTPYADLPESEQRSDRAEADAMLTIVYKGARMTTNPSAAASAPPLPAPSPYSVYERLARLEGENARLVAQVDAQETMIDNLIDMFADWARIAAPSMRGAVREHVREADAPDVGEAVCLHDRLW